MEPYSSVKSIWDSSYTSFSLFGKFGQVGKLDIYIQNHGQGYEKVIESVQLHNSTFHIKWDFALV